MHDPLIDKYMVFLKTRVGFEFEFFSDLPERTIASTLREELGKKISLGQGKTSVKGKQLGYHTNVEVTPEKFKLEKDFSGGPMMYELVTGPLPYFEAVKILIKALQAIHKVGWTNDHSSIHINISFEDKDCQIMFINILKFCLNFYKIEKQIFKDFPSRKNNIYTESITKILPDISTLTFDPEEHNILNTKVLLPNDSRYFGVNFQKMIKNNYLEFRYLGGKNYNLKIEKIKDYLEQFVLFSYDQAKFRGITQNDEQRFNTLIRAYYERMKFFADVDELERKFPQITVLVDLKRDRELINIRYPEIKSLLYSLVVNNGMRKGYINYDTEAGKFQVKDAKIKRGVMLSNIEFVMCDLSGNFENCSFYDCELNNSMIFDSDVHGYSIIKDSKLIDTDMNIHSEFDNCFIRNDRVRIGGIFTNCIIVGTEDRLNQGSEVDEATLFVDKEYGTKKKK